MSLEEDQLEAAIAALEGQRALLGDALVEAALGPMRARLASLSAVQERKYVTILFLDVVGSTTLSQKLDPEDVHLVMDDALHHCTQIITAHQGRVLKYAGDSVLAVFGADEALEDDAERAVLAGLILLEVGRQHGERVLERFGHAGFNVRVGLHSGDVLLGGGLDAENNIRGFHVNVAARMEQSAPAGGLRISHDTYRHVRGVFDVVPQPPLEVKGVDAPVATYLVLRSKPRAFRKASRGIEGVETSMVGREAELSLLQEAFARLYRVREFAMVRVIGEAGVGKSRLLYEFENWAESRAERFYFFQGRARTLTQNRPYGLLKDIMAWRFQIVDGDSDDAARAKFQNGVLPLFRDESDADLALSQVQVLGHLIGFDFSDSKHIQAIRDDARQMRDRGFHTGAQLLRRLAATENLPSLLLLDDMHWADAGSLDFFNYLSQANQDLPMLMVAFARPLSEALPAREPLESNALVITLRALDKTTSRTLVNELLKMLPTIPAALRELITSGAEGNPFYMEELVKMLIDEGAIVAQTQCWLLRPEKLLATHVPATLTGVLQARLDRLSAPEKRALQAASVIGSEFWDQALLALDAQAPLCLNALVRHKLIEAQSDGGWETVRKYAFVHHLLHQVTYDTVLKSTRRELHAKAALWFATQTGARAKDFFGVAAEHYFKAGLERQACEFFARAAEHACESYAHAAALEFVCKAWELLPSDVLPGVAQGDAPEWELRWRLLTVQERADDLEGLRVEQSAAIDTMHDIAEILDQDRKRCDVAWRRSNLALRTGDYATLQSAARQTMELAQRSDDTVLALRGQHRLALALNYLGDVGLGRALAHNGLVEAKLLGARALEALFLNALSVIADSQADQVASLELDAQDLQINRELGNRRNEAIALGNLGKGWLRLGAHAQARQFLEEGLHLSRAVGDRAVEPNTLVALSTLELRQGHAALALAHAQLAVDLLHAVGSTDFEAIALCALGDAHLALHQHAAAHAAFARSHQLSAEFHYAARLDALAGLARVEQAQGNTDPALQRVNLVLSQLAQGQTLNEAEAPSLIRLTCYQVLLSVGDARAPAVLRSAVEELQTVANTFDDAALRQQFLEAIPEHRATLAAWLATQDKPVS